MNRQLLVLASIFGALFVGGIVWFVVRSSTLAPGEPPPGPPALFDSDQDGLSDAREQELGTNPEEADSDFDGLSDILEVETYTTDPLLADSDGDGFLDGVEVRGGYDPLTPAQ
jgi:hypothetical protein